MLTKQSLMREFQKDAEKYWKVDLFQQAGFSRRQCKSCGSFFWSIRERSNCGNQPCQDYDFIGNRYTKKKLDYIKMWKEFEKFFTANGHKSISRYPVVDRWRPDLFFTIASIQDFQRVDKGEMSFVYPENPLIVPQVCLRFPDIPSVGLSGRHNTSFIMSGQHAFNYPKEGYFKDKCIDLNFNFLTKSLGVKPEDLVYIEDIWSMPDYSQFGPSLETFVGGLEVVNSVFSEFQATKNGFKPLDMKVIDVGWGHERLVWLSNGTNTIYDCVFGDLIIKMQKYTGIKPDKKIFDDFSKLAGRLNIDEVKNLEATRKKIAETIGIPVKQLVEEIEPMRALYAIADHTRTLLFAIADGGLPSNVGGGYNLRVLMRRCLAFLDEYNLDLNLTGLAEKHADFLKPMFPELKENIGNVDKIFSIESEKYKATLSHGKKIVEAMLEKGDVTESKVAKLYESNGITPELIKQIAKQKGISIQIPENFYEHLSSKHIMQKENEKKIDLNLAKLEPTKVLFYDNPELKEFNAKVLRVTKDWVILDQTLFYPESGGQECDLGSINDRKVVDVQKFGNIVAHKIEGKLGSIDIVGKIDWERRLQLRRHHTAIHILNATVKKVLGSHAWQAGTHKSYEKAHLDITHYQNLTQDDIEKIRKAANEIVKKSIKTKSSFVPRQDAEKLYGFGIYQGGHIPEKVLRIMEIPGYDIEACSGTHSLDTSEIGEILVVGTEKIQDGVIRITIKASKAAERHKKRMSEMSKSISEKLNASRLVEVKKEGDLQKASEVLSVSVDHLGANVDNFISEIIQQQKKINYLQKLSGGVEKTITRYNAKDLADACAKIFGLWKEQRKEIDLLRQKAAESNIEGLLSKARDNLVFDIVNLGRKDLIVLATEILKRKPEFSIILSNEAGDIIAMSETEDMEKKMKEICIKCGGSGGGNRKLAQGKVELSKLVKMIGV